MSMDIAVWSAVSPKLPDDLPNAASWTPFKSSYQFDGGAWLISVATTEANPDAAIANALPNAHFQTWISLEPIGADDAAYQFLESVTRTLAAACDGRWVHPGDGNAYRQSEGAF